MKYELVKMNHIGGAKASVYSVYIEEEQRTLFDRFIMENINTFKSELSEILRCLSVMAKQEGALEHYFKQYEGKPGDGVCALYDKSKSKLRLYCIRYGKSIIILGGGGNKPKSMHAFQEDDKLNRENDLLRKVSSDITQRIKDHELFFSADYMDFEGDLIFDDEDYE